jgi:hypothetical protein
VSGARANLSTRKCATTVRGHIVDSVQGGVPEEDKVFAIRFLAAGSSPVAASSIRAKSEAQLQVCEFEIA